MPRARTTSQGPRIRAAVARTAVLAGLAVLLSALVLPASAQPAGADEPTAGQRGPATGPTSAPEPARLDGAVTPRRYGLPTVLAVVLVVGVASLQLRLLLAEPAARRAGPPAAPRPTPDRRHGVGSPRW